MNIHYSEPYKDEKKGWKVDKFQNNKRVQTIDIWTEKLAYEFLETINITIDGKLCYTGL